MSTPNTFHLGICMAGAVSAGAYTAGVMDYLLEALDNWEQAKQLQQQGKLNNIPAHNVVIEVLSGASAGGMTAAITAAAVQNKFAPLNAEERNKPDADKNNPLYNAWVNLTEKTGSDMMDRMLANDDIDNCREVRSGFNSSFIKEIADNVLTKTVNNGDSNRPYIAADADIFTTVTNLRGFNYQISFHTSQGLRKHRMRMHKDIAFFRLTDGNNSTEGRIPLSFKGAGLNKEILAQAAMATGAFPVGLESRELKRQHDYIQQNKYLNLYLSNGAESKVDYTFLPDGDFESLNVDGGVINNEPFEITQQLLDDRRRDDIRKNEGNDAAENYEPQVSAEKFDTTVIMVDPFPNDDTPLTEDYTPLKAWKFSVPKILSAMRGQLMLKDTEIRKAYLSDDYTRFLISPVRYENGVKKDFAIACGSFEGFGGFFSKKFREHDFYLGRRNCQRFLQVYFGVPVSANNPVLTNGYSNTSGYKYQDDGIDYIPIIPDMRVVYNKETNSYSYQKPPEDEGLAYPSISLKYLMGLEDKFKKRVECILDNITNGADPSVKKEEHPIINKIRKKSFFGKVGALFTKPVTTAYLNIGKSASKGPIAEKFIDSVIIDMDKRGLLKDDFNK